MHIMSVHVNIFDKLAYVYRGDFIGLFVPIVVYAHQIGVALDHFHMVFQSKSLLFKPDNLFSNLGIHIFQSSVLVLHFFGQ